ncbi:type VI secretion system membrane subunit TssM [Pseudomonas sp. BIGb0164]|uniref:type VI secretion system membrane subunit TssM n=1 Tax=Pseudomonas sp. BIGb0164 TaxID=2940605 RepID=UPI002167114D|nr:type VI secretion system membrane subunit TssM [Pseudomonas sp. BIGb0164]MCS4246417.1 type VI secretion system protein ImpL [Pseudomonas sp. BIGb0164]
MNAFFKGAGTVLRKRWAWSLLLVLSMACMVWFLGPLLAVDDHRFWKSPTARLSTISLLFLLWGLAMVIASARHTVRQGKPEHQARNRHQGLVENERRHVRGRFKEALHTLKTTHRYAGRGTGWRRDLPWYLLIGQQGSGKSSLLAASGLQSPLDRREPATPQGTAFCDWYFADQGVLVETAGRYLSQLDSPVDAAGWATLLGLCKARRRTRPLNGVVVTVSIETLLGSNAHDLNLHARQVHSRLQDIQQVLHVDVPIYLVLTQADHLPGYAEFFDTPVNEGADGVLGAPVVIGKAGADVGVVRQAFEALVQRLSGELITRLHQERSTERRARILDFPLQLAQIGERLCQFIELAFCAHRYQRINGLRGFYLSSAAERRPPFGQGLFARVIFAEADLAGLQRPELRRLRRRQGALAITAVLVVGLAAGLWWHSYSANHQRLEQLAFLAEASTPAQPGADETLALLPLLDNRLASTRVFALAADTHWIERAGLYQGEATRAPLVRAYEEALLQLFLSQVTRLLEAQVRTSLGNREHLLDNLRAYLMLSLPARRDTGWLAQRMAGHWSLRHAGEPAVQARLNEHFSRLLEHPFAARLDEDLIAQARQALRGESLAEVVYRVLREQSRNLEPYRLADGRVFEGLDPPIPGFYGKRYLQYFEKQGPRLVNAIAQDNWVLGEATDLSAMDLRRLMVELQQRYFSEYADAWANALGGIRLRSTEDLKQGAEQLANLTSAQSPLVLMLQQTLENTRLLPGNATLETLTHDAGGALGTAIQSRVPEALLGQLPLAGPDDAARRALQRRFEPLHQLLDDQQNPGAELTQVLRQLDALHLQLAALDREGSPEQAAFQLAKRRMEGQQDALSQLRNATTRLPLPIKGWLEGIADDSWRHLLDDAYVYVNQRYQGEVYGLYAKAIRQRYPFNAHAASDVALSDFQEFFKPQGVLARFHDAYLKPFVGIDANRYRLRGLEGRSLPMSRSLLEQLTKAHTVRRSFFSGDQGEWAVRFTLAPYSLDQAVSRATLRVGDQQLEYRHGPIMPLALTWPYEAENGRSSLVLEREAEQPLGIEKNSGAWSLFRFFELMQSEPANGRDTQILKADLAGLRANYLLVSQRTPSPFQMDAWRTFRLPEQL